MTHDLVRRIAALSPPQSGPPSAETRAALSEAVAGLIAAAREESPVRIDPRQIALTRKVSVDAAAARETFRGRRILITGAAGCVAGALIPRLQAFAPAGIAGLDLVAFTCPGVDDIQADIRDEHALEQAFAKVRPEIVIHLAAEREPGKAEKAVYDAVTTNVLGSANVIAACQRHGVDRAIYSSTGKCFAYLTDHVYTATKKITEHMWADAGRQSSVTRFASVRFTHLLENGIVFRDIEAGIAAGLVEIHGPNRNFNLQNLNQATGLLLHAAIQAETRRARCFVAQDIGWPVNVLDFAVWRIEQEGRPLPLRFLGVPPGYDENFFRGQFDWSGDVDIHPLVNALEHPGLGIDASATIGDFDHLPVAPGAVAEALAGLREDAARFASDAGRLKASLLGSVTALTSSVFGSAEASKLQDVLHWGTDPGAVSDETAARFAQVISLLREALREKSKAS